MKSDTPLDYAVFQLSPKRSRCELLVSGGGNTERLASGLLKPFVTNLKFAEEQLAMSCQSIKLDIGRRKNAESWFTKGTLERFVRFVSTPEILELVNTLDAEMSQLESARRIYSQGTEDQHSAAMGGGGSRVTAAADATKKELLRAIDLRLGAVQQDLATAYSRAAAAGFSLDTVLELRSFADCFGARRLNEACVKFSSLCERRSDLVKTWKTGEDYRAVRSSYGSDMSIDDDPTSPQAGSGEHQQSTNLFQPKRVPTFQQASGRSSRESSVDPIDNSSRQNDAVVEKDSNKKQESSGSDSSSAVVDQSESSIQASQPGRRLSVQDRINLFENKQKESSGSGGGGAGVKAVVGVGKSIELRRLSSDVSSAPEKAVLRRWSGASDMSIDLSCEKKDTESPLCTPSSIVSEERKDTGNSTKAEQKSLYQAESLQRQLSVPSGKSSIASEFEKSSSFGSIAGNGDARKDQNLEKTQSRSSLSSTERNLSKNQADSEAQLKSFPGDKAKQVVASSINKSLRKGYNSGDEPDNNRGLVGSEAPVTEQKEKGGPLPPSRALPSEVSDMTSANLRQPGPVKNSYQKEDTRSREQLSTLPMKGDSAPVGDLELRVREGYAHMAVDRNSPSSQSSFQYSAETEVVQKKELGSREQLSGSSATKFEDSGHQKRKFEKKVGASEQIKKVQGTRDGTASVSSSKMVTENSKTISSSKMITDNQDILDSFSTPPPDHVQRVRQSKGNQELNDELKMKANELEKLFAQHKLRVPGDQSNATHKSKPGDKQSEPLASSSYGKLKADGSNFQLPPDNGPSAEPSWILKNMTEDNEIEQTKMVDRESYEDALNNLSGLSFSEGSRGKFYMRYMQKREAKLKEEWSSKRAEKEAKLKAMHDSLERSTAEMKAKFSGSLDVQGSVFSASRRTERLRSFNKRSITGTEQKQLDFGQNDNDEDLSDFALQKDEGEDQSFTEASFAEGLGKSQQNKKPLPTKGVSSSTPRTPAALIPRSAIRASNASSGRRKVQPENPLAQSVPNFSDLRKENTRVFSAASKTARPQLRNYARSKTSIEEVPFAEEKPRRSQSLKKTSAGGIGFKDTSALDSDGGSLTTLRSDKEERYDKYSMNLGLKPFPKKSSDVRHRESLDGILAREATIDESEEDDDFMFGSDDLVSSAKNEEKFEEGFGSVTTLHHSNLGNGGPELDQASDRAPFGLEADALRSLPQGDSVLLAELPTAVPPGFNPLENVHDSPGESPISWISRAHRHFAYSHDTSDIDASVDSPTGSPASWNSHSLSQNESDAARMRKKWGVAQKPMLISNSAQNQARKDMTKGFKRLLKFGRKSRGTENCADWISATTSEGDDDTEDGRDPTYRLSEDLRKSRMGFSQGNPSDDSFNDNEFFSEQAQSLRTSIPAPPANFKLRDDHLSGSSLKAPRSFFSLSSFRSKASESKPR